MQPRALSIFLEERRQATDECRQPRTIAISDEERTEFWLWVWPEREVPPIPEPPTVETIFGVPFQVVG